MTTPMLGGILWRPDLRPRERYSHTTAALLHGLWLPARHSPDTLHVTATGRRAPRRLHVTGHQDELVRGSVAVAGTRASHPVQAWVECAEILDVEDLVVMGDCLVRRRAPFTTIEELARTVAARPHHRGVRALRAALPRVRAGSDSPMETRLRLFLVDAGLVEPIPNAAIRDGSGAVIAHGDLVWPEWRIVLEYEGDHHRTDRLQWSIDIDRIGRLEALGWLVIRVDAGLLARPEVLLARIHAAIARR